MIPFFLTVIAAMPLKMPEPLPKNFQTEIVEVYEEEHASATEAIHPYRYICITPEDQELMYATVFAEAGNQGEIGMIAVAQVILNRVLDGYWGNDVESVISAPGQFAVYPYCRNGYYTDECRVAVDKALMGEDLVISLDYLFFSQRQVSGTSNALVIGDHVFSK